MEIPLCGFTFIFFVWLSQNKYQKDLSPKIVVRQYKHNTDTAHTIAKTMIMMYCHCSLKILLSRMR